MKIREYDELESWFLVYTEGFLSHPGADIENLLLKKDHTLRVVRDMDLIAGELSPEDRILALAAALLHDVGRFEQLRIHGTFSDFKSEDHASLGVRILKELNILRDLDPFEAEIILIAVENHNKAAITAGLSERASLISKLVRDADKLDIWRVVIEYYKDGREKDNPSLVHNLPYGQDVCTPVYEAVERRESVSYDLMESVADMKVLQMGWVYDLNTNKALALAESRGYLEGVFNTLPQTERTLRIFGSMKEYLRTKLEGVFNA
ncbi:MAG: HD domain-containing protein [Spirochaetales bacterium]|nr:HD domain-containing protein [Spirochaetales bacterium]